MNKTSLVPPEGIPGSSGVKENSPAPKIHETDIAPVSVSDTSDMPDEASASVNPDASENPDNPDASVECAAEPVPATSQVPADISRMIEKVEKEAYARGRAEALDEYLNPTPFFSGLHGAESAPADPQLQRILQTRRHVW